MPFYYFYEYQLIDNIIASEETVFDTGAFVFVTDKLNLSNTQRR
jgi:hypothetical protein